MKKTAFLIIVSLVFVFLSCGNAKNNKNGDKNESATAIDKPGKIVIGVPAIILPVMSSYAGFFMQENPKAMVELVVLSNDSIAKALKNGKINAGIFSDKATGGDEKQGFVASDAIVCAIHFNNPVLQKIVIYGIGTAQMSDLISGKIMYWDQLYKTDKKLPVKFYLPEKENYISQTVLKFYNAKEGASLSFQFSEADALQSILSNEMSIGFLSSSLAYDAKTKMKKENLYIVPLDFNNNELADDQELIYDDFKKLEKSVSNKNFPSEFQRRFYLRYNSKNEQAYITEALIAWIEKNGYNFAQRNGFFMNK